MRRTAYFFPVVATLAAWAGSAAAREDQAFHLANATFCIDSASVQVALDLPSRARTVTAQQVLEQELARMLEAALTRSQVTFDVKTRCEGSASYTLLVADVRYLDPRHYVGFGQQAYTYSLFVQMDAYANSSVRTADAAALTNRYNAYLSEIYAKGDEGKPVEPFVAA